MQWDQRIEEDCRTLIKLAVREDLDQQQDWTTVALVPADHTGSADIVAREPGVVAGIAAVAMVFDEMQAKIAVEPKVSDADVVAAGTVLATLHGNVRDLLTCERTVLNLWARLMGVATLARQYVEEVQGTAARIYDTRKTTPGWRRLEKYAAQCGGARNHRTGLFDAILIKDNHLAQATINPQDAVTRTRQFLQDSNGEHSLAGLLLEIEVDTLQQLAAVLPAQPDIVLLDNMPPATLREAVEMRDKLAPQVQLEASGGVRLEILREIAAAGVERISVGALTHSARSLDLGLDWHCG
ncbi:MAG: carboxylating nicotinate-nucleotide diphosphorylase [Planctomycetes bacterium]|nr:carboxylating nicotinate-nucleotide diphosphorylase [Planctomycetota bacterium]